MTIRHDFSLVRVRTDTFNAAKLAAEQNGQKLWYVVDQALNMYLQNSEQRRL